MEWITYWIYLYAVLPNRYFNNISDSHFFFQFSTVSCIALFYNICSKLLFRKLYLKYPYFTNTNTLVAFRSQQYMHFSTSI